MRPVALQCLIAALSVGSLVEGDALAQSWAEPAEAPESAPLRSSRQHYRLGIGTGLTFGVSEIQERSGDSYGITGMFQPYNLSITPSYQLTSQWAIGVRGGFGTDSGMRGDTTRALWELGAEGRYQPETGRGGYAALNAGVVNAVDSVGSDSASLWAPMLGAAAGYDLSAAEALSFGIELRGGLAFFGDEGSSPNGESDTIVYGTSSWLSFNLTGHFMF